MNESIRSFEETVDQRQVALPPCWRSLGNALAGVDDGEIGDDGIHRTGKRRLAARKIADAIKGAGEMVVASSFLLSDPQIEEAMMEAARLGKRVYLLLATEEKLRRNPPEDATFDARIQAELRARLARMAGHVLIRSSSRFHAKLVLVDPGQGGPGFLRTANLTREALERNEELVVELDGREVADAFAALRWAAWEEAEHEMTGPDRLSPVRPLGLVQQPPRGEVLVTARDRMELREAAAEIMESARSELIVASYGWEVDQPIVKRIASRAREGLKVNILARIRPSSMPALLELDKAGAHVMGFNWLHAKAIWSDAGQALVMSANLQAMGLEEGFETGVMLRDGRARGVATWLRRWIDSAPWELRGSPVLGDLIGGTKIFVEGKLLETVVEKSGVQDLGTIKAGRPEIPLGDNGLPRLAHDLRLKWKSNCQESGNDTKEIQYANQ